MTDTTGVVGSVSDVTGTYSGNKLSVTVNANVESVTLSTTIHVPSSGTAPYPAHDPHGHVLASWRHLLAPCRRRPRPEPFDIPDAAWRVCVYRRVARRPGHWPSTYMSTPSIRAWMVRSRSTNRTPSPYGSLGPVRRTTRA